MEQSSQPFGLRLSDGLGPTPHGKTGERYAKVLAMRRAGQTLQAIANGMGLSCERVRQMEKKAERMESEKQLAPEKPHLLLSVRARNCLLSEYWSKSANYTQDDPPPALVRDWLDSGTLRKIPNMGKKSIQEVAAWLAAIGA